MPRRRVAEAVDLPTCDRLWTTREVAAFLGVPVTTLHQWRTWRIGPDAFRVGRHLRYDPDVVRRWLVEQCQHDRPA
jgi:Helix-turn-helix domain